jgi:hypothetical protein
MVFAKFSKTNRLLGKPMSKMCNATQVAADGSVRIAAVNKIVFNGLNVSTDL